MKVYALCFNKYNITYYTTVNVILFMRPFDNFSFTTGLRDIYIKSIQTQLKCSLSVLVKTTSVASGNRINVNLTTESLPSPIFNPLAELLPLLSYCFLIFKYVQALPLYIPKYPSDRTVLTRQSILQKKAR